MTSEQAQALKAHLEAIAQILYDDSDPEAMKTLKGIELTVQQQGNVLDVWKQETMRSVVFLISAMVLEPILCPDCSSDDVVKCGRSSAGKPRYKCRNQDCQRSTFIHNYTYRSYLPEVGNVLDMWIKD